jgi:alkylation response protein AidB-like acyl-CoA dehydrogenase
MHVELDWLAAQVRRLAESGALGWLIPKQYGGLESPDDEVLEALVQLGQADLASAFVLTQYQAAVTRIRACPNEALHAKWLPRMAGGEVFATVGLSHLTTSRARGPRPAVLAVPDGRGGYFLSGRIPWVTAGQLAGVLVVGGVTDSGEQILALLEQPTLGIDVVPSLPLLALTESSTGPVDLYRVHVPAEHVLAGPAAEVMKVGATGGTGSLTTSALALAAGLHSVRGMQEAFALSGDLVSVLQQFIETGGTLREKLLAASRGEPGSATAEELRFASNTFAVQAAQCWLAAAKGTGFVSGHPAERAVRESMFFYVWSCPQAVVARHWQSLAACDATGHDLTT